MSLSTSIFHSGALFASIGVFDGVHRGHRAVIERVKEEAAARGWDSAIITFAPHPRRVLCPELSLSLLTTPDERADLLGRTGVDRVILLDFDRALSQLSAREFLQLLSERYHLRGLLVGYDHRFGHNRAEGFEAYVKYGLELGIEVVRADELVTAQGAVSSSLIRRYLMEGNLSVANGLLGYPYAVRGVVVGGYRIGRTLGFPTANLTVGDPSKLIPAHGVYAVWVVLPDGRRYEGMLNIGHRPTLQRDCDCGIEVHLLDYEGDLYGTTLTVEFVDYVRPERAFADTDALKAQLAKDRIAIERRLKGGMD